ncbi:MAG: sigma-70 family RNA polymerase sigma factor [Planctomycetota bacterium]|nr:MAG: sigma-70 family RNA polymerase sigma factor [Planctomycetota bacterium]
MSHDNRASDLSDAELVSQAQRGNAEAFGQLVLRYQDRVFNTMYRMCHNHADAMDLTQTAFLRAYEALDRFAARANFYTWIYRIAVNALISQRRSERRRPRLTVAASDEDAKMSDPPAAADADPVRRAARSERARWVSTALEQVDEEFRLPLILRDVEGFDYQTISEILGVPVGTVKSRIHRGRTMLGRLLAGEERLRDAL